VTDEMVPALEVGDCARFGESVYRFGRLAGECFSAVQGGAFASPRIAELIERLRGRGITGVGQSSWGPTVFAIVEDAARAEHVASWLEDELVAEAYEILVARANNCGAKIEEADFGLTLERSVY
jgi:predicted sugar kinase